MLNDIPAALLGSIGRAPWGWALLIAVVVPLIKVWPIIQLQTLKARAALRGEQRADLDDCKARLDAMDGRLTAAVAHIHNLDMRLIGTVAAYRILHDDMTVNSPDNPALHHATSLFQTTWDGPVDALGSLAG